MNVNCYAKIIRQICNCRSKHFGKTKINIAQKHVTQLLFAPFLLYVYLANDYKFSTESLYYKLASLTYFLLFQRDIAFTLTDTYLMCYFHVIYRFDFLFNWQQSLNCLVRYHRSLYNVDTTPQLLRYSKRCQVSVLNF